mmetsp:Transcript_110887/g.220542  ORF Transcript_110887/g.220542 Transcript_110887/m.220542 type:complete len:250 (-) Transcript_110887:231-980(-)
MPRIPKMSQIVCPTSSTTNCLALNSSATFSDQLMRSSRVTGFTTGSFSRFCLPSNAFLAARSRFVSESSLFLSESMLASRQYAVSFKVVFGWSGAFTLPTACSATLAGTSHFMSSCNLCRRSKISLWLRSNVSSMESPLASHFMAVAWTSCRMSSCWFSMRSACSIWVRSNAWTTPSRPLAAVDVCIAFMSPFRLASFRLASTFCLRSISSSRWSCLFCLASASWKAVSSWAMLSFDSSAAARCAFCRA